MKRIILLFLLLTSSLIKAQSPELLRDLNRKYDTVLSHNEGFIGVVKDGKIGYVDINGHVHIPPKFDFFPELLDEYNSKHLILYDFNGSSTLVVVDGQYRLINKLGGFILGPEFDIVGKSNKSLIIKEDNKYALFSSQGVKKTEFEFEMLRDLLIEGLFAFKQNNKYGVIDHNANTIYPNIFDTVELYIDNRSNQYIKGRMNSTTAIIDNLGKVVFQPYYPDAFVLDGDFILTFEKDKYGLATRYGRGLLHAEFDTVNLLIEHDTLFEAVLDNKKIVYNSDIEIIRYYEDDVLVYYSADTLAKMPFRWIIEPEADVVREFGPNLYYAQTGNDVEVLDSESNRVGVSKIENIDPDIIHNSDFIRLIIKTDKRFGLADYMGNMLRSPEYEDLKIIIPTKIYAYKSRGQWGLIDENGKRLTNPQYEAITSSFIQGKHYIKAINNKNKTCLYNQDGEVIFHPFYDDVQPSIIGDFFYMVENQGMGLITLKRSTIIEPEYEEIKVYEDTIFVSRRYSEYKIYTAWRQKPIYRGNSPIIDIYSSSLISIENNKIIRVGMGKKEILPEVEVIGDNQYISFGQAKDSLILAEKPDRTWVYLSRETFKPINTLAFSYATPFHNGFAIIIEEGELWIVNSGFEKVFKVASSHSLEELEADAKALYRSFQNNKAYHIFKGDKGYGIIRLRIIKE